MLFPNFTPYLSLLGELFIKALKSVAPILVFVLVLASIANFKVGQNSNLKPVMILYVVGMLLAAFSAVVASIAFPSQLFLNLSTQIAETYSARIKKPIPANIKNLLKETKEKKIETHCCCKEKQITC